MNRTGEVPFWIQMQLNFIFYIKYIDPVLLLLSICGAFFLFILIIAKKREIRYPTTTVIAICWLLFAEIAYLIVQFLIDLSCLQVIRVIQHHSATMCYGFMFLMGTLLIMQSYVQAVISMERLLAVIFPLKVKMYITKLRMICLLCLVTVVSACVAVGTVKFGTVYKEHPKVAGRMTCQTQKVGMNTAIFILVAWVLPPTTIATVSTIGIISTLARSLHSSRLSSAEKRLSLMLVGMNIILVLTSIPLSISYFLLTSDFSEKMQFLWNLSIFCTRFGAFTDWIIIFMIGSQLRRALRQVFGMSKAQTSMSVPLETEYTE